MQPGSSLILRWAAALVLGMAAAALPGFAQTPQPQPRVLYEMHSARINQIRATPDFERLVSVSQDKTLRVWRASDLTLMRTIAVPSESGEEGSLRALAITPDGLEVIVGGWTGLAWTGGQQAQAYRIELATGRVLQVLRGMPGLIESMAISRDGTRLAIGLGGKAGLRVLEFPSGRELWADHEYNERVVFADFAPDGRLATTSSDGCLRIYDPQGSIAFRAEYPPREAGVAACRGSELGGVRFSPDGKLLAFGLQDRAELVVFDPVRQQVAQRLHVGDPEQRSLCCPNWSVDGTKLHMHGAHAGLGPTPLYRVTLATGAVERVSSGPQRFTNVLPLPDGDLLVSTVAPSLVRIGRDGSVVAEALPPNGDFRFRWDAWRLDANAEHVVVPMQPDGADRRWFDVGAKPGAAFRSARPGDEEALAPPRRDGGLRVDAVLDEFGYKQPMAVNGQRVALKPFQSVRSWSGDERVAVLGTQWSVLVTDTAGRKLWEQDLPAPAYQVALSGNGRWVVALVGDGSLRWYAADTGTEVLAAFLHRNGNDWVAWRPDGSYSSSPGGDEYLAWLVNRGDAQEPVLLRAVQFERQLYRPEQVMAALRPESAATRGGDPGRKPFTLAAPEVRIEALVEERRELRVHIRPGELAVREIGVYADGIPVLTAREREVHGHGDQTVRLVIPPGLPMNRIRVEALTDQALGLDETATLRRQPAQAVGGRLWVLAIGVAEFKAFAGCGASRPCPVQLPALPNARNDAVALSRLLQQRGRGLYRDVKVRLLAPGTPTEPTKAAIQQALRELEEARPEDTVIVFLASHGLATDSGSEYYFLPADAGINALLKITGSNAPAARRDTLATLLSATELNDQLRRVPGRRFLIIDTCHSGAVGFGSNPYAVAKRSASANYAMLTASTGEEESHEHPDPAVAHGAFTYALLQALNADSGAVTLEQAYRAVVPAVARSLELINAAEARRRPSAPRMTQTPTLIAPPVLRQTALVTSEPAAAPTVK